MRSVTEIMMWCGLRMHEFEGQAFQTSPFTSGPAPPSLFKEILRCPALAVMASMPGGTTSDKDGFLNPALQQHSIASSASDF